MSFLKGSFSMLPAFPSSLDALQPAQVTVKHCRSSSTHASMQILRYEARLEAPAEAAMQQACSVQASQGDAATHCLPVLLAEALRLAMLAETFSSSASALALSSAMLCLLPSAGAAGHARLAPLASDPSLGSEASASSAVSSHVLPDPAGKLM